MEAVGDVAAVGQWVLAVEGDLGEAVQQVGVLVEVAAHVAVE